MLETLSSGFDFPQAPRLVSRSCAQVVGRSGSCLRSTEHANRGGKARRRVLRRYGSPLIDMDIEKLVNVGVKYSECGLASVYKEQLQISPRVLRSKDRHRATIQNGIGMMVSGECNLGTTRH